MCPYGGCTADSVYPDNLFVVDGGISLVEDASSLEEEIEDDNLHL